MAGLSAAGIGSLAIAVDPYRAMIKLKPICFAYVDDGISVLIRFDRAI